MGCASSTPLTASGPSPEAPPYDLRNADPQGALAGDDSVAGKVRQTVTGMADALPVQDMIDGVSHVKDDAFHKLQDFGETVKDKVESVVEDVEDKIGSALGTVKEKTAEKVSTAQEEMDKAVEEVEEVADEKMDEAKEVVDTMVEDLEENLPLPEKQESENKEKWRFASKQKNENKSSTTVDEMTIKWERSFQMNATKGSRASTAELSTKSHDESKETDEEEIKTDKPESSENNGGNDNPEGKTPEENSTQEENSQSPQNQSLKSGATYPTQTEPTEDTGLVLQIDQTSEDPIVAETNTQVDAIPIDRDEIVKEESKGEGDKDMTEAKESLTVDLPPEEKEGISPSGKEENEPHRPESGNNQSSPMPHIDTPRPPTDNDENHGSFEPPIEKTTVMPPENQPELDLDVGTSNSPEGKNDSAISSSSLSPEQELAEGSIERQETPIIEVA